MVAEVAEDAIMDMVTEEVVDWAELPHHIVELIIMNITLMINSEISDYVRCGAVCTSWRTVFIDHHHHPPPPPHPRPVTLPFLIVPTPSSSSSTSCSSKKKKKKKNNNRSVKTNINTKSLISFYNVIDKKVYNQFQVTIPSNRYFRGSSHGWLVAVDQNHNNCQVRLFNPFLSTHSAPPVMVRPAACSSSRVTINAGEILLPSLKDIYSMIINKTIDDGENDCVHDKSPSSYVYLKKAVLSADPLSNPIDYIVMAILGSLGRLAYCRPGRSGSGGCHNKATAWTLVEFEYKNDWGFSDVIYYEGKFYALGESGKVVVLDPTRNMMAVTLEIPRPRVQFLEHDSAYLVESGRMLFQVYRKVEVGVEDTVTKREPYSTTGFKVFVLKDETKKGIIYDIEKMNYQEQKEKEEGYRGRHWQLVKDLGESTFFIGDNHSIGVHASDYPGLQPNSIYFTDDYINIYHCKKWNGPHDLGVFNLVSGTIESHYPIDHGTSIWPVPIWIQPTVLAGIDHLDPTNNK